MTRVIKPTDVGHLPEVDRQFPVIVEYTEWHVVWVEAESVEDAVASMQDAPYEVTSSDTCVGGDYGVSAPKYEYEWLDVNVRHNAHVQTHRDHLAHIERKHVEAIVEDETRDGVADADRRTCAACKRWREDGHDESAYHLSELWSLEWTRQRTAEQEAAARLAIEKALAERELAMSMPDRILLAVNDPGAIVGRKYGPSWPADDPAYRADEESVSRWQRRAVLAVLGELAGGESQ